VKQEKRRRGTLFQVTRNVTFSSKFAFTILPPPPARPCKCLMLRYVFSQLGGFFGGPEAVAPKVRLVREAQ
jgi:hypothetical protein